MTREELALVQRRHVRRNLRRSFRGLALSALVVGVVASGALPLGPVASSALLALALALGLSRAVRGLWAVRVARISMRGWSERRLGTPPLRDSADRRAVVALTMESDEPLVLRARDHALALVDRGDELQALLADTALSPVLRRPVAEERARVEQDLEALMSALTELRRGEREGRQDLLQRLAAHLEVERLPVERLPLERLPVERLPALSSS